ncbi:MAG TPA: aspartate-semialdehyde dehydrogenase [Candidatus Binatia bacterium]|nr:aspartate-semialdehyde dehydrogenase [Candidatus Binatia bacterium]
MRICILGATGLVGRETLVLCERAWPGAETFLYASRDQTLEHRGRGLAVRGAAALEHDDAPRGDLAFVALDDEHSKRYVPRLLALGYRVIDKSNTYRMDPRVPLVTAGVNDARVAEDVQLVANPNCTTIPFALALAPLARGFGLEAATVSTYQAVSGAGIAALDEFLADSTRGYGAPERIGTRFDPAHYAGNTVPHSGKTDESGYSAEERKLMFESRKILDLPELPVSAQCCRVPVAVGHYINAWVTLRKPADLEAIAAALGNDAPFVRFFPGSSGEGLSALACVHDRDRALVGRLRRDDRDRSGRGICVTMAGDNLRLGAATNAVRLASRWYPSADPDLDVPR